MVQLIIFILIIVAASAGAYFLWLNFMQAPPARAAGMALVAALAVLLPNIGWLRYTLGELRRKRQGRT